MEIERAKEINSALVTVALFQEGLFTAEKVDNAIRKIEDFSIQDMLAAGHAIRAWETETKQESITTICCERMIAAIFMAVHYTPGSMPLVLPDRTILLCTREDMLGEVMAVKGGHSVN